LKFSELAAVFEKIEAKSSRLAITDDLAALFKECTPREAKHVAYLIQGILAPQHEGIQIGMADKMAVRSIALVSGKSVGEVEALYRKTGDLGIAAQELLAKKRQAVLASHALDVEKVYDNFFKIAVASGSGSQDLKIKLLAELLSNASPTEAKVIVRFVTGSLRLGVGDSTILDALSVLKAGSKELRQDLERAYNLTSDLGFVTELFLSKGLEAVKKITPMPFKPIRPALAERLENAEEIIKKMGECSVEQKFDGFRLAVHKQGSRVELYSRRQEKVTLMFPDVVEAVKKQFGKQREFILEGEALAFNEATGSFMPFQETMQRKRKHGIAEKAEELPLKLFVFELLYLNGVDYTLKPYEERRKKLSEIIEPGERIAIAPRVIAKTGRELQKFFDESVEAGLEGIIAKDLKAPYTAGARKFAWIKLKRSYSEKLADTLDVVIVGYYFGKGKRTQFGFGGLLTAVYDDEENRFRTVAKIGTGFSEAQMKEFSEMLSKISVKQKPANVDALIEPHAWVKPQFVVEVKADEITRSPIHTCAKRSAEEEGLALRFPRLVRVRDKKPEDATTEKEVFELFEIQHKRAAHSHAHGIHAREARGVHGERVEEKN